MNAATHSTTPFSIPVRRDVAFDFSPTPAHHFAGRPRVSHLWNAVSILAPYTEAFLIRAMKRVRDQVRDDALRRQVDAFLAQEALHTRQHNALNARLAELGYDLERAGAGAEAALGCPTNRDDAQDALALVIAGEYAIYVLARSVLECPALLAGTTPEVRRLMEWNALEEMEHQSVACDVYRHLYGEGPMHRLVHTRALLKAVAVLVEAILIQSDPETPAADRRGYVAYLVGAPGLLWRVVAKLSRFFMPGFRHWSIEGDAVPIAGALERVTAAASPRATAA